MKKLRITFIVSAFMLFVCCEKTEENKYYIGDMVGFVNLIDEFGNEVEDKSGVKIQIENTAYSSLTDENGRFQLSNIPAGSYKLVYFKEGYGTYKRFNFQFIGGNVPALINETILYQQPGIEVENLEFIFEEDWINIKGEITETKKYTTIIFINDSANVSNLNYDYSSDRCLFCCYVTKQYDQYFYLNQTPYLKGDKVYLVIYFINPYEWGYFDYEEEKKLFTSYKKATDPISLIIE